MTVPRPGRQPRPAARGRIAVLSDYGEPLHLMELDVPDPSPGSMLLGIRQASICGSDLHMWRGEAASVPIPSGGRAMGHEGFGVIEALGPGVDSDSLGRPLRVGDRVVHSIIRSCGRCAHCVRGEPNLCARKPAAVSVIDFPHFHGTFADFHSVAPGTPVFRVPDDLPDAVLAPVNCAWATAMQGLIDARMQPGDSVVLQGAGGLGIAGTAIAREMGASTVIVLDRLDTRLELAREFGADHTINVDEMSDADARIALVRELTGGDGADVVLELVGVPSLLAEGVAMLRNGGVFVEIGLFFTGHAATFDVATLVTTGKRVIGSNGYAPLVLPQLLEMFRRARRRWPLERLVSHTYPLADINAALMAADWSAGTAVTRGVIVP